VLNGLRVLRARKGETLASLAARGQLDVSKLTDWNDYNPTRKILEGDVFYLERKQRSSAAGSHTASGKETLWEVSQQYGVRLAKLKAYNRGLSEGILKSGTIVVLGKSGRSGRSSDRPILLDSDSRFEWNASKQP